jgi:hypothetical protein
MTTAYRMENRMAAFVHYANAAPVHHGACCHCGAPIHTVTFSYNEGTLLRPEWVHDATSVRICADSQAVATLR